MQHLFSNSPERFLASDFSQSVKLDALANWLDFAYGEERGPDWLEVLRQKTTPWHAKSWRDTLPKRLVAGGLAREKTRILPALQKLVAKNDLLAGYVEQYKLFERHKVTSSVFQEQLAEVARQSDLDELSAL